MFEFEYIRAGTFERYFPQEAGISNGYADCAQVMFRLIFRANGIIFIVKQSKPMFYVYVIIFRF